MIYLFFSNVRTPSRPGSGESWSRLRNNKNTGPEAMKRQGFSKDSEGWCHLELNEREKWTCRRKQMQGKDSGFIFIHEVAIRWRVRHTGSRCAWRGVSHPFMKHGWEGAREPCRRLLLMQASGLSSSPSDRVEREPMDSFSIGLTCLPSRKPPYHLEISKPKLYAIQS